MNIRSRFSIVERDEIVQKSQQILRTARGQCGLNYLLARGLDDETIKTFELGYVPASVNHQLQDRIIFPLRDASGNLVCITSRYIGVDKSLSCLPVYWHESYEKLFYLFGVPMAKDHIRSRQFVVVVEGQFDVLRLYKNGLKNVVGLLGTKMSMLHFATIYRYCEDVIIMLDSDDPSKKAGQRATEKIINQNDRMKSILSGWNKFAVNWLQVKVDSVSLPGQCDPDEYVRDHGINDLNSVITNKIEEMRKKYVY